MRTAPGTTARDGTRCCQPLPRFAQPCAAPLRHNLPSREILYSSNFSSPIFLSWAAEFEIAYMQDVIDEAALVRAVDEAGRRVGIGDYRPRFGRFSAKVIK